MFASLAIAQAQTDWPVYGHDPGGTRYSPLKQITPKNVSKLAVAWTYDTQAPLPPGTAAAAEPPSGRPAGPARGTPLLPGAEAAPAARKHSTRNQRRMYLSTSYSRVLASGPKTEKDLGTRPAPRTAL
jgi:quinoprotein glucose dehydrogenase